MKQVNKSKPVLVTSANGYIGSWITKESDNNFIHLNKTLEDIFKSIINT